MGCIAHTCMYEVKVITSNYNQKHEKTLKSIANSFVVVNDFRK